MLLPGYSLPVGIAINEPKRGSIFDFPNFMPDGKSILFVAASSGHGGYDYDVYRMDIASGSM